MKDLWKIPVTIVMIPILTIATLLGFITCWQCHEVKHVFQMKRYEESLFEKKPLVCKGCHKVLNK